MVPRPSPATAPAPVGAVLPLADGPCERRDAAANRERILAAARSVLAAEGAAGLSMNAVASAAGVGKGTIFRRFGDRDGLTRALLDAHAAALQDGFLTGPPPLGPAPGVDPSERLEAFLRALVAFHDAHLEIVLAAARSEPDAPGVYGTFLLHVETLIRAIDPRLDAPVLARLLLDSISPRTLAPLLRGDGVPAPRVADAVVTLARGLTTTG